jgi:hypothetical protein
MLDVGCSCLASAAALGQFRFVAMAGAGRAERGKGGIGGKSGGRGGGKLWTSSRQVWRSPGDISFQRSALFKNC